MLRGSIADFSIAMFACDITPTTTAISSRSGQEARKITPIGFLGARPVSLFVALSPLVGWYPDGFELIFSIVIALNQSDECSYFDGLNTKEFIPDRHHRALIRSVLHASVDALVDDIGPPLVSMTTHTSGLPPAALHKFDELVRIMIARGYTGGPADPFHGRQVWMLKRVSGDFA